MNCMKCGKEIGENRVFCEDCLEVMSQFPVRPGTPVHLPSITPSAEKKVAPKKRQPTPEEYLARFRKATRWLSIALASTLLVLSITISLLINATDAPSTANDIGKNYNTVNTLGSGR